MGKATLRLFSTDGSGSGGTVYSVSNNYFGSATPWNEWGLTWNNAPDLKGPALFAAGAVDSGSWVEYDVTAAVSDQGPHSFAVVNNSSDSLYFNSRQAPDKNPELVVETLPLDTFAAVFDASVNQQKQEKNYGGLDALRIKSNGEKSWRAFLKFNVEGLRGTVFRATLRLFATDGSDDGGSVYRVSNEQAGSANSWTEWNLNWANAPEIQGVALSMAGAVEDGSWVEFDVTNAIDGDGVVSFAIESVSANSVYYSSRQSSDKRPHLVIETSGVP